MKDEKTTANDPEKTLLTLDQLSQTIEVMTNVVNRLREHLSAQLNAQAAAQARRTEAHGENAGYAGIEGFPMAEAFNDNDGIEGKMAAIEKLEQIEQIKEQFPAALTAEQLASSTQISGKQTEQTAGNQAGIDPVKEPRKEPRKEPEKETSIAAQQAADRKAGMANTKAEKQVSFVVEITQTEAKPRRRNPKILH